MTTLSYEEARDWLEARGGEVSREDTDDGERWTVTVHSIEGSFTRTSSTNVEKRIGVLECVDELRRKHSHLR